MPTTRRNAVTLVEILIATALVALLCTQGIFAASAARSDAHRILCAKRLGDLARACQAYAAQDPGDMISPVGIADRYFQQPFTSYYGFGGKSGRGMWHTGSLQDSHFSGSYYLDSRHRPLNQLIYKTPLPEPVDLGYGPDYGPDAKLNLQEYHCPADAEYPGSHIAGWRDANISSYNYFGTSYITNPLFIPDYVKVYSGGLRGRAQSEIANPAMTILLRENASMFAMIANNPEYSHSGCYWTFDWNAEARGWHGESFHFNMAFVDGSTRYVKMQGYPKPAAPFLPDNCPWPNGGYGCICAAVRGVDWQLDTLPATPIETNKRVRRFTAPIIELSSDAEFKLVD